MTPTTRRSFWHAFGPGLLFAGAAVGVSHLVQSTRAGAIYGLALVGVVLLANVLKYPAFRFGPLYTAATGHSLLEGYRRQGRWALWLYGLLTLGTMFTVQAAVTLVTAGLAKVLFGLGSSTILVAVVLLAICAGLLGVGQYRLLDRLMKVVVAVLTVSTLMAAAMVVPQVDWAGSWWPTTGQLDARALFFVAALVGWMPSAIDVSVWQSLWVQARSRDSGQRPGVREVMTDFNIGYFGTALLALCFLLLGAGVMHGRGVEFSATAGGFAAQVIELYVATLGEWSRPVIGACAFAVMCSTTLTVVDGFPRALSGLAMRLRGPEDSDADGAQDPVEKRVYWLALGVLGVGSVVVLALFIQSLKAMVDLATTLSFLTAPLLAWLNHRAVHSEEMPESARPGPALRWGSLLAIVVLGVFAAWYLWLRTTTPPAPKPKPAAEAPAATSDQEETPPPAKPVGFAAPPRAAFNRTAAELYLPLFWREDANKDGLLDANELALLHGYGVDDRGHWLDAAGAPGPQAVQAFKAIAAVADVGHSFSGLAADEQARRKAVLAELGQGRPTLIETDLRQASAADLALVRHVARASRLIEELYRHQQGASGMGAAIGDDDKASKMLLHRNQGPWCEAPATEGDPNCTAHPGRPKRRSGLYPFSLQSDSKFCEALAARDDARELLDPFKLVRNAGGDQLKATPYALVWPEVMQAIAAELRAAAAAQGDKEEALVRYLRAAADAFAGDDWFAADEAWAAMTGLNSRWYLRIGPDETYFEPCGRKAGFHVSFGRIDPAAVRWQERLSPLRDAMEKALAELAGPPYEARKVAFKLPDFVRITLNAGESRGAHGGTAGQSLPNWGPVASQGRGRTVAMTNLGEDADSHAARRQQVKSLLCAEVMELVDDDSEPELMSTILHEAAHNLGPSHDYKVNGKTDAEAFGGPLASIMEELKAQTAALWLTNWLVEGKVIKQRLAHRTWVRDVIWTFSHISRGLTTPSGKPRTYSQLAAIQLSWLMATRAVNWHADKLAANSTDTGCFDVDLKRFGPAVDLLARRVFTVKASADKVAAESLRSTHAEGEAQTSGMWKTIQSRWQRAPRATFVYSLRY